MRMIGPRHFFDDGVTKAPDPWQWGSEFAGQVVVILGNGPSLGDFNPEQIRGTRMIALNSASRWAAPVATADDFLYFADNSWSVNHPDAVEAWPGRKITANRYAAIRLAPHVKRLDVTDLSIAVQGNPDAIHASSGHTAAVLAAAMGARRVVLLGFDARHVAGRSHWHGDYQESDASVYAERFLPGWWGVGTVLDRLGVEIVNATPDSAIEAIAQMPLAEALAGEFLAYASPEELAATPEEIAAALAEARTPARDFGAALFAAAPDQIAHLEQYPGPMTEAREE